MPKKAAQVKNSAIEEFNEAPELPSGNPTVLLTSGNHKEKSKFLGLVLVSLLMLIVTFDLSGELSLGSLKFGFDRMKNQASLASETANFADQRVTIHSANAAVMEVDAVGRVITVGSTDPNLPKAWRIHVTGDTILSTFDDWSKINSESTSSAQVKRKPLSEFKQGDIVYVIGRSDQDLAIMFDVEGVDAVLWQSKAK